MSLAKITLLGNLTRDGENRYTPSGTQNFTFSVAVNGRRDQNGKESVAFYRCTAWNKLAEVLDRLAQQGALVKGKQVLVIGSLEPREYQANDGATRMSLDVNVSDVQLTGSREPSAEATSETVPF